MPLQKPTVALIQEYVTLFSRDAECVASDAALALLVKTFPRNQEMGEVLLKVAAVNQIYNAGLQTKAIYAVARLICASLKSRLTVSLATSLCWTCSKTKARSTICGSLATSS